jgi:hypothetical protein
MYHRAIHAIEDPAKNLLSGKDSAYWYESPRQGLGEQHHVRFNIPVLDCEETTSTSDSGLNFVSHKQGFIFAAKLCCLSEVVVGRHINALALYGLDDEGGDRA